MVAATCLAQAAHEPRTLFVVGTYTIGKEVRGTCLYIDVLFNPESCAGVFLGTCTPVELQGEPDLNRLPSAACSIVHNVRCAQAGK
jgi:hypothetical protein